jgi:hypothetical protein
MKDRQYNRRTDNTIVKLIRTDHTIVKLIRTERQTMIYKTLHRQLNIEQQEPTKTGVNSGTPEG